MRNAGRVSAVSRVKDRENLKSASEPGLTIEVPSVRQKNNHISRW